MPPTVREAEEHARTQGFADDHPRGWTRTKEMELAHAVVSLSRMLPREIRGCLSGNLDASMRVMCMISLQDMAQHDWNAVSPIPLAYHVDNRRASVLFLPLGFTGSNNRVWASKNKPP